MAAPAGDVDATVDVDLSTINDLFPVYRATQAGEVEQVEYWLQLGANVELGPRNTPPLCLAAEKNNIPVALCLILGGANVNAKRESDGATPISIAACKGNHEMIAFLLEKGADPTIAEHSGYFPLSIACVHGCMEAARVLLDVGAVDVNTVNGDVTALRSAIAEDLHEFIPFLVAAGADIFLGMNDSGEWSPAYLAAQFSATRCVAPLVQAGADVDMKCHGASPLCVASERGNAETMAALIEAGADIDAAIERGDEGDIPPILLASICGHEDCVRVLIEAGADVDYENCAGESPIYMAVDKCHLAVVKLLVTLGTNLIPLSEWLEDALPEVLEGDYDPSDEGVAAWLAVVNEARVAVALIERMPGDYDTRHQLFAMKQLLVTTLLGANTPHSFIHAIMRTHMRRRVPAWLEDVLTLDYPTRRRLVVLCGVVYRGQVLARLGGRGAAVVAAKACELIDLLMSFEAVRDLLNLRLVCRLCETERRFPVPPHLGLATTTLDTGMVEEFVGGDAAHFVPTGALSAVLAIWGR